jgi:hypothetical protein
MKVNKAFKQCNPVWIIVYCVTVVLMIWVSVMANQKGLIDFKKRLSLQPGATIQGSITPKAISL